MNAKIKFLDICLPCYFQGYSEGTCGHLICFPVPSPKVTWADIKYALIEQEADLPEHCPISQYEYFWAVRDYIYYLKANSRSDIAWQADPSEVDENGDFLYNGDEVFMYFALEWYS